MNREPVLLVFENEALLASNLTALKQRSRVILIGDAPAASDMGLFKDSFRQHWIGLQRFAGPLGDSRFLFELRDLYFLPIAPIADFEILIYGGKSLQVMPQYYIFKKLLNDRSKLSVYSPQFADGIKGFHDVLSDAAFDGYAHKFIFDTNRFGFEVLVESSNA